MATHIHQLRIYYEDTDLSGVVYHANYLKYFERGREHLIGPEELVRLCDEDGVFFTVYRASLTYREGARLGDVLEVRTCVKVDGRYRLLFDQSVWRPDGTRAMVEGEVQLVCTDRAGTLIPLPENVIAGVKRFGPS